MYEQLLLIQSATQDYHPVIRYISSKNLIIQKKDDNKCKHCVTVNRLSYMKMEHMIRNVNKTSNLPFTPQPNL